MAVGVHNYYLDFLKSFKKFISDAYPEINHYQFNYSSTTYLNYKLYKEHVQEFPLCHINLNNIQVQNVEPIKRLLTKDSDNQNLFHIANNNTREESVFIDFKFVTLYLQVKINVGSTVDIFNYLDIAQSQFPLNFMFYDYIYRSYINLEAVSKNWEVDDDTENVFYRSVHGKTEMYAIYETEPIIKINSLTSSKNIELKYQDGEFIEFDIEVQLKVPRTISKNDNETGKIKGIEIVINTNSYNESLPILIDMNNNIYSDLQDKAEKVFIIPLNKVYLKNSENSNNNTDIPYDYCVSLSNEYKPNLENKKIGIYMIDDSCKSDPNILFIELGTYESLLTNEKIKEKQGEIIISINPTEADTSQLEKFNLGELSVIEIITFK